MPPRPDYGAILASLGTALLLYLAGANTVAIFFVSFIIGMLSLPLLLMAREIILFKARKVLTPEQAGLVAEWIQEAGSSIGHKNVVVLYAFRKGYNLQVVQLGGMIAREEAQLGLLQLMHRAAWNAMPAAGRSIKGALIVAVPARIMELFYSLTGKSRHGVYIRATSISHIRLVYGLLKEMIRAAHQNMDRVYVAYVATKALTDMIVKGWLRLSDLIVDKIDEVIPPEPYWVKNKVKMQLAQEAAYSIEP
jgi:hypothetical protein